MCLKINRENEIKLLHYELIRIIIRLSSKGGAEMNGSVRKTFLLPEKLLKEIEQYQRDTYSKNLTDAVIQLLVKGLEKENRRKEVK